MPFFPWCSPTRRALQEITQKLDQIGLNQEAIMSEQSQEQTDINAAAQFDEQLDTDVKGLTAQVAAGQAALDTAIANLKAQGVDTSELVAAQAVLAGDQPDLDAAVAALSADANADSAPVTPVTPPAGS